MKHETIKFEEDNPLGPISDINVFAVENDQVSAITREELGSPARKCIICDKTGHECKKNKNHTTDELHQAIDTIINENVTF